MIVEACRVDQFRVVSEDLREPETEIVPADSLSSGGVISGTCRRAATFNFTVRCTDSQTPTADTDDQALSITVNN